MPTGGIFIGMSQGDIFVSEADSDLESSDNSQPPVNHLQNLEDFEKRALQEGSESNAIHSLTAENMLGLGTTLK